MISRDFNNLKYIDMTDKIALSEYMFFTDQFLLVVKFDYFNDIGKSVLDQLLRTKEIINLKLHSSALTHVVIDTVENNLYAGRCDDIDWVRFIGTK